MARKINNGKPPMKTRPAVAMIVDGCDEVLYLEQAKKYYSKVRPSLAAKIKPELPTEGKKLHNTECQLLLLCPPIHFSEEPYLIPQRANRPHIRLFFTFIQ